MGAGAERCPGLACLDPRAAVQPNSRHFSGGERALGCRCSQHRQPRAVRQLGSACAPGATLTVTRTGSHRSRMIGFGGDSDAESTIAGPLDGVAQVPGAG